MIKRLQIRNFRTHKKLDIKFCKRVNSIIGNNYSGKSTILRAIRYMSQNKPSGDSVIRWGASKTSVRITDERKNKIKRIRGKRINLYKLNDKEFKAFGNKVPEEIQKTLGLSDINFQGQHDAPFWFSKTAGEVSRELNVIVNLDIIDSTLSSISSEIQTTNTLINITEKRYDNFKAEKRELKYVKGINESLKHIESLKKQKDKNVIALLRIKKLVEASRLYSSTRELAISQLSGAVSLRNKYDRRLKIAKKVKSLSKLIFSANNLQSISKYKSVSFKKLDETYSNLKAITALITDAEVLINKARNYKEITCHQREKERTLKIRLKKAMGTRCPLCEKRL